MNKNTIILLLAFIGLGAASFYFLKKDKKTTILATDKDFRVEEKQIYKVFLADRNNQRLTVERVGHSNKWRLNGKYDVAPGVIFHTLEALSKVEVQYVPPKGSIPFAAKSLAVNGIKVEVYGQNDVPLRTYYVGGNTTDGHGTYYIMEGSEQPYVMGLPGFVGELRPRFQLKEYLWRDKTIFADPLESIKGVSVEYPQQKASSFKIAKQTLGYEVLPFYDGIPRITKGLNKGIVQSYVTQYERIIAEGIDNDNPARDSIVRTVPFAIITLNTETGNKAVRIFPIAEKDVTGLPLRKKTDRYFAESNQGDFFLIQDEVFRKLFYDYKGFFN
jgi:hypothetical protein